MGFRLRSLALLLALLAVGCGQLRPMGEPSYYTYHTVRAGETLYSIAFRYGYDYHRVARWNRIGPPYTIMVGQQLAIIQPNADRRPQPVAPGPSETGRSQIVQAPDPVATTVSRPAVSRLEKAPSHPNNLAISWQWPTEGDISREFSLQKGVKGIDIRGQSGQRIVAAADGKVVYSGNGLIGYGNLVIIKHNHEFLSAYGHNRKLLVKEGEQVVAGQKIAEMGQATGKTQAMVHFEIRKEGKPVNPTIYLPKNQ